MAESNFPVEMMGKGFAALFNAVKRIAVGCSPDEKAAIFADAARRVHCLECWGGSNGLKRDRDHISTAGSDSRALSGMIRF